MCRLPHCQCRSNRNDVGGVRKVASRQRSKMIQWCLASFLSPWAKARKKSELISTQEKGEMEMPKEMSMKEMSRSKEMGMSMGMNGHGGHLYMQTNEVKNAIIHYHRSANGTLTEVERVATGGAGARAHKPIRNQGRAPHAVEGSGRRPLPP